MFTVLNSLISRTKEIFNKINNSENKKSTGKVLSIMSVAGGILVEEIYRGTVSSIFDRCQKAVMGKIHYYLADRTYNIDKNELENFLEDVCYSDLDKAKIKLEKNILLALCPADFSDPGKRRFKHVSGLQYAVWALDSKMFNMFKDIISKHEDKLPIVFELFKAQLSALFYDGIEVEYPNLKKWHHIKQSPFSISINPGDSKNKSSKKDSSIKDLLKKIEDFQQSYKSCGYYFGKDYEEGFEAWFLIGRAQLVLPAYVIKEYLTKNKNFMHGIKNAGDVTEIPKNEFNLWYETSLGERLGENYAHVRGGGPKCRTWNPDPLYMRLFNALADTKILDVFRITPDLNTVLTYDKAAVLGMLLNDLEERDELFNCYKIPTSENKYKQNLLTFNYENVKEKEFKPIIERTTELNDLSHPLMLYSKLHI